jgi:hypothetical protein
MTTLRLNMAELRLNMTVIRLAKTDLRHVEILYMTDLRRLMII